MLYVHLSRNLEREYLAFNLLIGSIYIPTERNREKSSHTPRYGVPF